MSVSPDGRTPILIAGIGASAGGLEALKALLAGFPSRPGIGFVVIQHLEPTHESHMAEILAMHTGLKVRIAEDNLPIEADCVYTNPANKYLECRDGVLRFAEPVKEHGIRMPIDFFLRSLAEDFKERTAGIILSGNGSDGIQGLRAIKDAGGLTVAQSPQEAQFPAMPEHAIEALAVDLVLALKEIPEKLMAFANGTRALSGKAGSEGDGEASAGVERIVSFLFEQRGFDFRAYKRGTIRRRIERRMSLTQAATMQDYLGRLDGEPSEADRLVKDLMIAVTRFFRDPESFEELGEKAVATIVSGRTSSAPVRVWVPGCSTGEEAYSLAMLIMERTPTGRHRTLQVFATDIDKDALDFARAGVFPASIAMDVSVERLERFFTLQGDDLYHARRELRECIVFASHNLLTDAPFSRLDLVSCRNVLIYLTPSAQQKALSLFALALNPGGFLFLGGSDSAAHDEPLFEVVSRKHGLYRRTTTAVRPPVLSVRRALGYAGVAAEEDRHAVNYPDLGQRALVRRFAACILLVDKSGQILHIQGPASKYLNFPPGRPTLNLFALMPEPLNAKMRAAFEKAIGTGQDVDLSRVTTGSESTRAIRVTLMPTVDDRSGVGIMAVIFTDAARISRGSRRDRPPEDVSEAAQLREELKSTREDLQAVIARLESANADLTAANEEVVSMNEELQSTVEELETSKEEGLSVNEELTTVNAELRERGEELKVAYADLSILFNTTTTITLLLDQNLRLRRFTRNASVVFHVNGSDVGKPLFQITSELEPGSLEQDAAGVIRDLIPRETEIRTRGGVWYSLRILPYRTADDRLDGVVMTLTEVSRLKHAEQFAESIVETGREPLVVVDADMRAVMANAAFRSAFRIQKGGIKGREVFTLGNPGWDSQALRDALMQIVENNVEIKDFVVNGMFPGQHETTALLNARRILGETDQPVLILIAIEDVTESLRAEDARQRAAIITTETETEARERKRFSQILHDQIQQLIVAAKMAIDQTVLSTGGEERGSLVMASGLLQQALQTSRDLTMELAPLVLFSKGMSAALEWIAREYQKRYGLVIELDVDAAAEPAGDMGKTLLFQCVWELLFNVVKHSGEKHAALSLRRADGGIAITVSDKGRGIDAAALDPLNEGLAGYGIASIRERLALLGGRMEIQSAPGKGTTVSLWIGSGAAEIAARRSAPKARDDLDQAAPAAAQDATPHIRVVLVDDHSIVRQGISRILNETRDIRVVGEAGDGLEGVDLVMRLKPDVVVMDSSMPRMNGDEAIRIIVSKLPGVKVIALSMHPGNEMAMAMRDAGAVAYLTKGGPSLDLVEAIRRCMTGR